MNISRIADAVAASVQENKTDVGDVEVVEPIGEGVHKDRTTKMMSSEMVSVAREIMAGNAFKNHTRGMTRAYNELMRQAESMSNLLKYRLTGDGNRGMDGKPTIDKDQQKAAKEALKMISGIENMTEELMKSIKDFDKKASELDDFMQFST